MQRYVPPSFPIDDLHVRRLHTPIPEVVADRLCGLDLHVPGPRRNQKIWKQGLLLILMLLQQRRRRSLTRRRWFRLAAWLIRLRARPLAARHCVESWRCETVREGQTKGVRTSALSIGTKLVYDEPR